MNQAERLNYLVERFKEDSGEYRNMKTPADTEAKKCLLRSLMNIRIPKRTAPSVIAVHKASAAYLNFLRKHEGQHMLFLEIGVGSNTRRPSSIRSGR